VRLWRGCRMNVFGCMYWPSVKLSGI